MDSNEFSRPVDIRRVKVSDPFWSTVQETVRREVIPYQWEALNDRVPGAEPSFCMHNFRAAARLMARKGQPGFVEPSYTFRGFQTLPEDKEHPDPDKFYGFVFQDSDFYKWVEAAAYSLSNHPDPELESTVDGAIDIICAAQHESGYLDTYYILNGMDGMFTNLKDHHELYCLGHLVESAVAYYQATGKDKLLCAARRYADYVGECFGPEEGKRRGYPGHEIAEMALVRLYEVTGEQKYLDLSKFFLDQRGASPNYFLEEEKRRARDEGRHEPKNDAAPYAYYQAHKPVREQDEAVGHAVRAGYLYSGMADVARMTGDESLLTACRRLWNNIVRKKLYITGGIGGTAVGEAFSYPYDLPNDTAYSETCAAISLAFFARRMLEIAPVSEYADVMELAMYNTVLAGMALDGKSFFYVNPLEAAPEACRSDARLEHVETVRQKWFGCACCPPNIARIVSSAAAYAFTERDDTLFTHLYMGSEVTKQVGDVELRLTLDSDIPWEGSASMTVHTDTQARCTLAFRLPGWCRKPSVTGPNGMERIEKDGYVYFTGIWKDGDRVELNFPMDVRLNAANPMVKDDLGRVAVTRGPICFCMEQADNGENLQLLRLDADKAGDAAISKIEIGGQEMVTVGLKGFRMELPQDGAPLYTCYAPPKETPAELKFIPYYAWANRGEGEMSVWVRV